MWKCQVFWGSGCNNVISSCTWTGGCENIIRMVPFTETKRKFILFWSKNSSVNWNAHVVSYLFFGRLKPIATLIKQDNELPTISHSQKIQSVEAKV